MDTKAIVWEFFWLQFRWRGGCMVWYRGIVEGKGGEASFRHRKNKGRGRRRKKKLVYGTKEVCLSYLRLV